MIKNLLKKKKDRIGGQEMITTKGELNEII